MTPGSNLLSDALALLGTTTVTWYQYASRVQNTARQWVTSYNAPVTFQASVQSVNRNSYNQLGLDMQRNYIMVYASANLVDVDRDSSGDQFVINGRRYQAESESSWVFSDGWASCLCVEVKNNPNAPIGN